MFWFAIWAITPIVLGIEYFYPNKIKKFIGTLSHYLYKVPEANIKIILDGEVVANYSFDVFLERKKNIVYDFILYTIPAQHNKKYDNYVLRYDNADDIVPVKYTGMKSIELTDFLVIIDETDCYPIDFGRTQYLVNGNVLFDRTFLKWYLNDYYNVLLNDRTNYRINFRDPEKKIINLPDYCYLLIKKNNFIIVNLINDQ